MKQSNNIQIDTLPDVLPKNETTTLVNNTSNSITVEVPSNQRWKVHSAYIENDDDVMRNCFVQVKRSGIAIGYLIVKKPLGAGGTIFWPMGIVGTYELPVIFGELILKAGDQILFIWNAGGASTGGSTKYGYSYALTS